MAESGFAHQADSDSSEAEFPTLAPGDVVAPGYEVIEHVRRGEALDVYEVFSAHRLCSCIAKTVRPDRANVERVRARLRLEGHLLQTLAHPMLLRGFETISEPRLVIIAETLTGPTLDELITERVNRLPVSDLCHLGQHIASATQYLHAAGYLHLDIRPSNIIAEHGLARVIDLSLARPPGMVHPGMGSELYLAPEQGRGGLVTAAADVWGIGVTLYEAATRVSPFTALSDEDQEVLHHHRYLQLHRAAPLSTVGGNGFRPLSHHSYMPALSPTLTDVRPSWNCGSRSTQYGMRQRTARKTAMGPTRP